MSISNDNLIIKETSETVQSVVSCGTASEDASEDVNEVNTSGETKISDTNNLDGEVNMEFNRTNIEAFGNYINLVDTDEENKLDMFCYVKCNDEDNKLIKQCRGVVFNDQDIVMKAFPYTTEYNHTESDKIDGFLGEFKDWTFYNSHEGCLIRLFYFNGKWYVSTHRKLNAFKSKWASRESFGTSFKNALVSEEECNSAFKASLPDGDNILDRFQSILDTSKQYMFLVHNNKDNRIVCDAPERATVYHVGTFVDGNLVLTDDINIPVPKKHSFSDINELQSFVDTISYRELPGIIGFTSDNRQVKILHKDYQDLFLARGNEPSIKFRYLQVRLNRSYVNMLYHLYPEMGETFDEYESTLYDIARSIYRAYVQRFIKKCYVTVPREEFAIIRECHSWHLSDRTNNRISLEQVVRVMNKQSSTHLNHMIRRFKLEQTRQKNQQDQNRPRSDSVNSAKSFEQSPAIRRIKTPVSPMTPLFLSNNISRTAVILPRKPLYKPKTSL